MLNLFTKVRVTFQLNADHGFGPDYIRTLWTRTEWEPDVEWDLSVQTGRTTAELKIKAIELVEYKPNRPGRPLSYRERAAGAGESNRTCPAHGKPITNPAGVGYCEDCE